MRLSFCFIDAWITRKRNVNFTAMWGSLQPSLLTHSLAAVVLLQLSGSTHGVRQDAALTGAPLALLRAQTAAQARRARPRDLVSKTTPEITLGSRPLSPRADIGIAREMAARGEEGLEPRLTRD